MSRALTALLGLAAALVIALPDSVGAQEAASPPGAFSKALRALGLEKPPGKRGDKAYRKGDYEEALRQYGKAAEETAIPPPLLNRNIGNALYRQKRYPQAIDFYERALKGAGRDSLFASRAHHNLGNAFYRKAEAADSTAAQEAIADLREAVAHYKKALRQGADNRASKQNLEMANARLAKLLAQQVQKPPPPGEPPKPPEPSGRAKEALARALQLAQERRYAEAAKVLDDIMKSDRTAASFAPQRQRIDDVMKILRGEAPSDPAPRDPRATPWNPGAPGGTGI